MSDLDECQRAINLTYSSAPWVDNLYNGVFGVAFPILLTLGTLTNLTNLVILTRPAMKSNTYRWLRVLAGVDVVLCLLTVPVCVANSGHEFSPSQSIAHYYAHFGWSLSIGAQVLSFYLMGWFAFERFLAVCRHHQYPGSQATAVFRKRVCGTLAFVVILYLPTMIVGSVCHDEESNRWLPLDGYHKSKTEKWKVYVAYTWLRELLSRLVPALTLTACNLGITLRLRQLRCIRDGFGSGVSPARKERERQLVLLLFWVTALFYIFNAPVMVYYLGFLNHPHNLNPDSLLAFAALSNLFQMVGNISNFLLYFLINPEFRRTLRHMFHSAVRWGSVDNQLDTSETRNASGTTRQPTPAPLDTTTINTRQLTPAPLDTTTINTREPTPVPLDTTTINTRQPTPAPLDTTTINTRQPTPAPLDTTTITPPPTHHHLTK